MKSFRENRVIWVATTALFIFLCCWSIEAAEKKKITFTYTDEQIQTISKADLFPNDTPKHTISQVVQKYTHVSLDPDIGTSDCRAYFHSEAVKGSGAHQGYSVCVTPSGDKTYSKIEGVHQLTVKEGGGWEVSTKGEFQFTGGTGKFKNVKGGGSYKGKITAKGAKREGEGEMEY